MKLKLPALPYEPASMSPGLSTETFEFHYGKHHKAYIDNFNKQIDDSPLKNENFETIVKKSEGGLFNQAAQSWNHTFYWYGLAPENQKKDPSASMKAAIDKNFGSMDGFKASFTENATKAFGSAWTWLVKDSSGALKIVSTSNAENPLRQGHTPLMVCDVWEHAYYIDYRNARPKYLESYLKILNWEFISKNFDSYDPMAMEKLMKE